MDRKVRVICPADWVHHNTGWPSCVREVRKNLHTNIGVDFYSNSMLNMLENGPDPERPWVGVMHATPEEHVEKIISESRSMKKCMGLFGLSEYVCNFLRSITDKKVSKINLAIENPLFPFNHSSFLSGHPKIVMVGHWMRNFESIYELEAKGYRKTILKCSAPEAPDYDQMSVKAKKFGVHMDEKLNRKDYEKMFESNVVFLHLNDSSANNTIIECIVNSTPLLINRLPAVEEHLGRDYPLFYESIGEASKKIKDIDIVLLAHKHLQSIDKEPYRIDNFASNLSESEVYRCLPSIKI